jgi:hypothetical protein
MARYQNGWVTRSWLPLVIRAALAVVLTAATSHFALAAEGKQEIKQEIYASPEDAAKALVAALKARDAKAVLATLGAGSKSVIQSGDAVADRAARDRFLAAYDEANKLVKSGDSKAVLTVGRDEWPFPIPIVKSGASWRFDARQGRDELLNRRIGRNELYTTQAVQAYVDAQREYYARNPQKAKLHQYAQRFGSSEGRRDGLYWPVKASEQRSPLGPLFAQARSEGYKKGESGKPSPYHGYHYRILKAQGPNAAGGAYNYVVQGAMIGGFALVAYPAAYGSSGVMTFLVNHDGVVYEKDLGPDTASIAQRMSKFDPDSTWKRIEDR